MARQPLGQHFLSSQAWRERIFESLPRTSDLAWVEIGAGHGEFTELLARQGARVFAIERDAHLAARLRERAAAWSSVTVIEADVLAVDLASLIPGPFRVYGSLPYYITSPILRRVWSYGSRITEIFVVVQLEVAARLVASPGSRDFGFLSALASFHSRPRILLRIPPEAFSPPPKVISALVGMQVPGEAAQLGIANLDGFLQFVLECFGQKRKTLLNNLRKPEGAARFREIIAAVGLPPNVRAETMALRDFAALYQAMQSENSEPQPVSPALPPPRARDNR